MTADSLCNLLRCAIYVVKRGWKTALEIQDVGSGASPKGEELVKAARGGGSSIGLSCGGSTPGETRSALPSLPAGTGFTVNVSLSEALDLSTPGGRALAGMLAAFADDAERDILRDRVRAC